MSKPREMDKLATPPRRETIAQAGAEPGCRSVAYTYNDPVMFHEYAIDVAQACPEKGISEGDLGRNILGSRSGLLKGEGGEPDHDQEGETS